MSQTEPDRSRKRPKDAPCFVAEFRVGFSPSQRRKGRARLNCGTILFNAALAEAFKRLAVARADPRWAQAQSLPAKVNGKANPARNELFKAARTDAGFSSYALMSVGSSLRVGFLREHVAAQEAQELARRAFRAVDEWSFGVRGRPRFKPVRNGIRSLASKDQNGALRVVADPTVAAGWLLQWGRGFTAPLHADLSNPVQTHALAVMGETNDAGTHSRILSARIVRKRIKGRHYFYAQVTLDGQALQRYEVGEGTLGLDLGPSTIATVSDTDARLDTFCSELTPNQQHVRRLQRRLDRQHRAGSPACFDPQGRHSNGRCAWVHSKRATHTTNQLAEAQRALAEHRKSSHGRLSNRLLAKGKNVHAEKLSKKAWQKRYGKSVQFKAPGALEALLCRKAENAGGNTTLINPYAAKLSQLCVCGRITKKPLSLRVHQCPCGIREQRDVWSAFLARHCDESGQVDLIAAQTELRLRHDIGKRRRSAKPQPANTEPTSGEVTIYAQGSLELVVSPPADTSVLIPTPAPATRELVFGEIR